MALKRVLRAKRGAGATWVAPRPLRPFIGQSSAKAGELITLALKIISNPLSLARASLGEPAAP